MKHEGRIQPVKDEETAEPVRVPPDRPMYVTVDTRADYGEDRMVGIDFFDSPKLDADLWKNEN